MKIKCYMHPSGKQTWEYHDFNDRTGKPIQVQIDHKTAVLEIKIHGLEIVKREVINDVLIIEYGRN